MISSAKCSAAHSIALLTRRAGHEPVAKLVLQHRVGIYARSRFQSTALEACMEEYEGLAKLLLQHGADADVRYKESLRTNRLRTKHHGLVKPYRVQDVR